MDNLNKAINFIGSLTNSDKRELLYILSRDLGIGFPGIEVRTDICGGEPRIVRTRIPVWLLEKARRSGAKDSEILSWYPTLKSEDLLNAWNYVRLNKSEIDCQIRQNEEI